MSKNSHTSRTQISLAETLDRVLNKGAVLTGEITISVADIDLLYLGLNLVVTSIETIRKHQLTLVPKENPDGTDRD